MTDKTDLRMAILVAEDEEGGYEPIEVVSTIGEAREIAISNLIAKQQRAERDQDPGLCPYVYRVWAGVRGWPGKRVVYTFIAAGLLGGPGLPPLRPLEGEGRLEP